MDPAARLSYLARRRGGLFTRAEAARCGYSTYQIRRRMSRGEWVRVVGSVLAPAALELTPLTRDIAAHLAIPGSVLAGPAAARCWQMPVPLSEPCVYIGAHRRTRVRGVQLLYGLPDERDLGHHGILPITWREQTVFDCLRLIPASAATTLLDRALQQRWITVPNLMDRIHRHAGRHGIQTLIKVARAVVDGTRSAAERIMAKLLRGAGITDWVANEPIYDEHGVIGEGDFVIRRARLVIEIDGMAFHTDAIAFQRDRERQNRLQAAGWTVLRFTWFDLTKRPGSVIAQVRAQLRRRP